MASNANEHDTGSMRVLDLSDVPWESLIGSHVTHFSYGQGNVIGVSRRKGLVPRLEVSFDLGFNAPRMLSTEYLNVFSELNIPNEVLSVLTAIAEQTNNNLQAEQARQVVLKIELAKRLADERALWLVSEKERTERLERERVRREEERAQRAEFERIRRENEERERPAREEFAALRKKYEIEEVQDPSPLNPLYAILLKINSGELLTSNEEEWLIGSRYFALAGNSLFQCFERTGDHWMLVKACTQWRRGNKASRVIQETQHALDSFRARYGTVRLKSALLTTRGGAFRDLFRLDDAQACANAAISSDPNSFYPYNLLGAIEYQLGRYAQGEDYFERALALGAKPFQQDADRKAVIERASPSERREIARFLLGRDSIRFAWAGRYL